MAIPTIPIRTAQKTGKFIITLLILIKNSTSYNNILA